MKRVASLTYEVVAREAAKIFPKKNQGMIPKKTKIVAAARMAGGRIGLSDLWRLIYPGDKYTRDARGKLRNIICQTKSWAREYAGIELFVYENYNGSRAIEQLWILDPKNETDRQIIFDQWQRRRKSLAGQFCNYHKQIELSQDNKFLTDPDTAMLRFTSLKQLTSGNKNNKNEADKKTKTILRKKQK